MVLLSKTGKLVYPIRNQSRGYLKWEGAALERGTTRASGVLGMLYFFIWVLVTWVWCVHFAKHNLRFTLMIWAFFWVCFISTNKKYARNKYRNGKLCGWHRAGEHLSQLPCVLLGSVKWGAYKKISKLACSPNIVWFYDSIKSPLGRLEEKFFDFRKILTAREEALGPAGPLCLSWWSVCPNPRGQSACGRAEHPLLLVGCVWGWGQISS